MVSLDHRLPAGLVFPDDESVMRRALEIAQRGLGRVEPNPMVGAVIVDDHRRLIAEDWHENFGSPHAEIRAIEEAATDRDSTTCRRLFVSLEPCSHHGKTPPCSQAVINAGFRQVIIGCEDPAPHTAGRGISELKAAGIDVVTGVCEEAARDLIAPFTMLQHEGRPWVHAKWAMTLDGKIASRTGHSQWITCEESRAEVHRLRGRMDAIITGAGTVRSDDPLLTARPAGPRTAVRIVLDADGKSLSPDSQLLTTANDSPVIVCLSAGSSDDPSSRLKSPGVEILRLPETSPGRLCVAGLLKELGSRQMTNVLLEAGSEVLGAFFDAGLIDEVHAFVAPKLVGGPAPSPVGGTGLDAIPQLSSLRNVCVRPFGSDTLIEGRTVR